MRRGSHRLAAALAILAATASPVFAAPKKGPARAEFDRGVAAYTKGDYAGAADALGKSFALEADAETLFAWAQTERKLDRCDKAVELYDKLLQMKIPDENKDAVRVQIEECKAIIAAATPDPKPDPKPEPVPEPDPTDGNPSAEPEPRDVPPPADESPRAWWKNPVGGALVGLGVVAAGVGTVFLVQGSGADSDKANATSYNDYEALADKAESRGQLGVISLAVGGALIAGGVIFYATQKNPPRKTISGWAAPSSGGLVVSGRF